jgi:hypothetical protein
VTVAESVRSCAPAALCVLAVAVLPGGPALVLILAPAIAVAVCVLAGRRRGRHSAASPEFAPPFRGVGLDHEQTLAELLALVGSQVHVLVAPRTDGWGVATLRGTLTRAGDVGTTGHDTLFFAVGSEGGFFLPRQRFHRAYHVEQPGTTALALHIGDALVYVLDDEPRPQELA